MKNVVMQLLDHPQGQVYLRSYDPDAYGGRGHARVTPDVAAAARFPDVVEGWKEWKRESTVLPLRPDGQPNRPLTAYTVTFVEVGESE